MDFTIPVIPQITVKKGDVVILKDEPNILYELVRHSQQECDVADPLQTEVWTSRFAAALNEKYALPPEHQFTSAEAQLFANGVIKTWKGISESFYQGLQ